MLTRIRGRQAGRIGGQVNSTGIGAGLGKENRRWRRTAPYIDNSMAMEAGKVEIFEKRIDVQEVIDMP